MKIDITKSKIVQEDIKNIARTDLPFEELKETTFLIAGATGLIGTYTVLSLIELNRSKELNIKIEVLTRDVDKAKAHFSSLSSEIEFYNQIEDIEPNIDYILDFSSPTSSKYFIENPVETMEANIVNLWSLLELALDSESKKVIYSSSLEVYGNREGENCPLKEDTGLLSNPSNIRDSYPISKIASEMLGNSYAHEYGIDFSAIRYAGTFGPSTDIDKDERFLNYFIRQAFKGEDIVLQSSGQTKKQTLYIADAITALFFVLFNGEKGEAFNAADPNSLLSIKEMALKVSAYSNEKTKVITSTQDTPSYFLKEHITEMNTERLQNLGWKPNYSFDDLIARTLKFMDEFK